MERLMPLHRTPLHVISIAQPCHENWAAMTPAADARFCAHCQRQVHDLSNMTTAEVDDLLCRAAGPLCIRYSAAPDGRVATLDYQKANPRSRRWFLWAIPASLVSVAAAMFQFRSPPPPAVMMGDICPLPTTTSKATTQPTGPSTPSDTSADDSAEE
jgi:hypothetical protein